MSTFSKHNRLNNEKSPYLLQHATNPVDWYPWSEEAFNTARKEDKPIFLSIGYSTCHWCHVMAHESFEDQEVAEILNEHFISIKVDREERPDIDHIYMMVCQALTGHGGWPLTIIMDADKKPFYAATYLPRSSRGGLPGMLELLPRVAELWDQERDSLLQSGEQISRQIFQPAAKHAGQPIDEELLNQAFKQYARVFDAEWGGFGPAPKFPSPHNLLFLLRYYYFMQKDQALEMVEKTLQSMYRGGIYDHIGFGFARYSTDRHWLVPHFEKMLYDNALLAMAYLECYQLTGNDFYAGVARDIFSYVLRDMTHPEGGFYSAEDADSEGEEGKFYVWSQDEIEEILGEQAAPWVKAYGISSKGNFEGKNIPNLNHTQQFMQSRHEFEPQRQKLFDYREKRVRPLKDDKILTAWNGLMIAALAMGARILGDEAYLQAARQAIDFINHNLRRQDGRLLARYREGKSEYLAYAADYAFFIWGLIELYEADFDSQYLALALRLNEDLCKYFWDPKDGGLFFYGLDAEQLLTRPKDVYDGAMPSDNAVNALNFMRLARLTANSDLEEKAQQAMDCFAAQILEHPTAHSFWLLAVIMHVFPGTEIVVAGQSGKQETREMLTFLNSRYDPNKLIVFKDQVMNDLLASRATYLQDMHSLEDKPTAYICENFACREPLAGMEELLRSGYV